MFLTGKCPCLAFTNLTGSRRSALNRLLPQLPCVNPCPRLCTGFHLRLFLLAQPCPEVCKRVTISQDHDFKFHFKFSSGPVGDLAPVTVSLLFLGYLQRTPCALNCDLGDHLEIFSFFFSCFVLAMPAACTSPHPPNPRKRLPGTPSPDTVIGPAPCLPRLWP